MHQNGEPVQIPNPAEAGTKHRTGPGLVPSWPVWLLGNLVGFGLGSLGSANRAFVGYLAPVSRSAEFFGLWGMVFKLAAVLTIPFGLAKDVWGTSAASVVLLGFLVTGAIITLFVDEKRGVAAALAGDAGAESSPNTRMSNANVRVA